MQGSRTSSMLRWRKPERPLGKGSRGKASSSRWWGACCNGRRAKGGGSPSIPRRVETAGVAPSVAPEGGATGIFQCPHCSRPQDPPNPPGPEAPGGAQARQPPCSPTSPTAGYERPASMSPARLMKAPSCRGAPYQGSTRFPISRVGILRSANEPAFYRIGMVGVLAERARMGATASSIRGFTLAVRVVEDLQWICWPSQLSIKGSQRERPQTDRSRTFRRPGRSCSSETPTSPGTDPSLGPSPLLPR